MLTSIVLGLCAVTAVIAAPPTYADDGTNDSPSVLHGDTNNDLSDKEYLEYLKAANVSLEVPEVDTEWLNFTVDVNVDIDIDVDVDVDVDVNGLDKRQSCASTISTSVDTTQTFVDWDVQMSNVVCAGNNPFDVTVLSGWSISNTISISGGIDPTAVKNRLEASFGVDFSRSWTSSASNSNRATISPGWCGVMITKPITTRRYGRVWRGCIGNLRQIGTFMADDRGTDSYNGVSWISGRVTVCEKKNTEAMLSRCTGGGYFV